MEDRSNRTPSWFGLSDETIQQLAHNVVKNNESVQTSEDVLCKPCRDIHLDALFCGARFPSENLDLYDGHAEDLKADILKHIISLKSVKTIASRKSCALCRVLTAVHQSAHPQCQGENEQCILLPVRGDCYVSVVSGRLSIEEPPLLIHSREEDAHKYATNVHVLFRSRPLGATKLDKTANSHFRDEEERWIMRLDVRDAVDDRLCYNHATGSSRSINWTNLKTWLSLCTSSGDLGRFDHERCFNSEIHLCRFHKSCTHEVEKHRRIKGWSSFRCIDVDTAKLIHLSLEDHYVALSYVWGSREVSRNDVLHGDEIIIDKLPRIIQDAIAVTQKLDERYLWVDLICIDQNDPQDVQEQIERMDLIYRLADVTLVAAVAEDANSSLPGVTSLRPIQEHVLQVKGSQIYCSVQVNHDNIIGSSTWNKRGWTFQERLLSTRCLHFLDSEVVFQCKQTSGYELLDASGPLMLGIRPEIGAHWISDDITLGWSFSIYEQLVQDFTRRQFKYESDILKAFSGITAWLNDCYGRKFVLGLPADDILPSLLWTSRSQPETSRRGLFPSWTWAEWRDRIEYRHYVDFDRFGVSIVGPGDVFFGGPTKAKIVRQALIHTDLSESNVRRLEIVTDVRRFKILRGPPETTLDEATESRIHKYARGDPKEIKTCRSLYYMVRRLKDWPLPKDFDHYFVDQEGKLVFPQAPDPNPISLSGVCYQKVRLSSDFDEAGDTYALLLLAHVTNIDEDRDDGVNEHPLYIQHDHVFSMLVRSLADNTFERVALFTWRAEDWQKAEQIHMSEPLVLI